MIAQFQEQDRKRQQVVEEKCSPPSPRFVNSCCDCSNCRASLPLARWSHPAPRSCCVRAAVCTSSRS